MASPYPRLSFDRADRCLLTSVALTASVVATLMGLLAWTSPPPTGHRQDPPSFVRWMQLLGTPKNLRHARVLTVVPMASDDPSDGALTSLSWDITSSPCSVSCWAPTRLPRMCFSYEPPVPDHARDLFGPVLLASEVAAAVTRPEAVPRVRVGRVTTAISEVSGPWSRATWHRAVRSRVTQLRWCLSNGPPRQHAEESVRLTLTADAAGRIYEGGFSTSSSRLRSCVRSNISPAVLPVRRRAERSRSQQHGRATLTVSVTTDRGELPSRRPP